MIMKRLHQYLNEGPEIEVGEFIIRQLRDGHFWIERKDGEGTQVSLEDLEEAIAEVYREVF